MGTQALHVPINEVYEVAWRAGVGYVFEIIITIDIVVFRFFLLSRPPR